MSSRPPATDRTIIGFDLGHGETSLARLPPGAHDPEIMQVPQAGDHFPTAVAVYADASGAGVPRRERTYLGGRIFLGSGQIEDDHLYFAFKSPDVTDPRTARGTELFVGQILDLLAGRVGDSGAAMVPEGTPVRWIFGVPSGWDAEVCERYRTLLAGICGDDVLVVPESRAAMLYALHSKDVVVDPGAGKVLVVDLGSLTADYTVVSGLVADAYTDGQPLGASQLDKEIMRRTIAEYGKRPGNDPELLDAFLANPTHRARLEMDCRAAKEEFFRYLPPASQLGGYPPVDKVVRLRNEHTGETIKLEVELTTEVMEDIFATSLDGLGMPWGAALASDLHALREKLADEAPATIVMTGGASRMVHAQRAVREVFPESSIVLGTDPQFAIAKGLAIVGRKQKEVAAFREEFDAFVSGPEIPGILDKGVQALAEDLGKIMSSGLAQEHMVPAALKWRNGDLETVQDIEGEVKRTYQEHLTSAAMHKRIRTLVERWTAGITDRIDQQTRPICERAGIPAATLSVSHRPEHRQDVELDGGIPQKMALDIFNQIGNWMVGTVASLATMVALATSAAAFQAAAAAIAVAAATGTAASVWNPWLVTAIALATTGGVIAGAVAGKKKAIQAISTRKIHPKVRHMVSAESLQKKTMNEAEKASLETTVAANIAERFMELNAAPLTESFLADVRAHLNAAADRAEMLIRPAGRVVRLDEP